MQTTAVVNYHVKQTAPQAFYFDVDGIEGNLVSPELVPTQVSVQDLRTADPPTEFGRDGITFTHHSTAVASFRPDACWQETYDLELEHLLRQTVGAREVLVFDHTVRVDDASATRKPARNVHNDYSVSGARQRLADIVGCERAQEFEAGHYGFVNVWRPVEHAIETSPLGFVRPSSTQAEDWMDIELIYPDRRGQILGLAANPAHEWFYLSRMTPDEVAIFNIHDNRGRPFLGHSALDMQDGNSSKLPRKSIESRTLVRYR
ncbi:MAG: CmcJ/NvfI family oxidoreductase [Pseudomonadota bacterium]